MPCFGAFWRVDMEQQDDCCYTIPTYVIQNDEVLEHAGHIGLPGVILRLSCAYRKDIANISRELGGRASLSGLVLHSWHGTGRRR